MVFKLIAQPALLFVDNGVFLRSAGSSYVPGGALRHDLIDHTGDHGAVVPELWRFRLVRGVVKLGMLATAHFAASSSVK